MKVKCQFNGSAGLKDKNLLTKVQKAIFKKIKTIPKLPEWFIDQFTIPELKEAAGNKSFDRLSL